MEVVVFICRTEKSQGIVTAQIEQETMRVTSPDFLRPAFIIECILSVEAVGADITRLDPD